MSEGAPRRSRARTLRASVRRRAPQAVAVYQRSIAPLIARDKRYPRLTRWVRSGIELREEFAVPAYVFDRDGVWVRDHEGLEWAYEPGAFLSAFGKEYGLRTDLAEIGHVRSRLRAGCAFVDVGGHVGAYSIPTALACPGSEVHCFEPVPATRSLLERNIARNKLTGKLSLWPLAVSDRNGTRAVTTALAGGENHLLPEGADSHGATTVESVTLDSFLAPRCARVDVIKLDIEGGELAALRGADAILKRDKPDLILELDAAVAGRYGHSPADVVDHLERLGYGRRRFVDGGLADPGALETDLREGNNFLFTVG